MVGGFYKFVEQTLFAPCTVLQRAVSALLAPLGSAVGFFAYRSLVRQTPVDLGIKIISVGNLTIGGSGKTPLVAAIANCYENAAIVLRGYGRKSRKPLIVDHESTPFLVGDEALVYRFLVPKAIVIVSADRRAGALMAKELGASIVLFDDGFRHRSIAKFDILIRPTPEPLNDRLLPAGCYRLPKRAYDLADFVAIEGSDFCRNTALTNQTSRMVLVTAISRPKRLDPFLPSVVAKYTFPDHSFFDKRELEAIVKRHDATSLLVTRKDAVKLTDCNLPLTILEQSITLGAELSCALGRFVAAEQAL
ncbi:tetraacyldisaccharide 4'-kinase [Campylobacterota bacterium]|nr:tetraacyldisaccharide 4'-kinase [Campylobacterota bacterium]